MVGIGEPIGGIAVELEVREAVEGMRVDPGFLGPASGCDVAEGLISPETQVAD
jgi:hypothetical protein